MIKQVHPQYIRIDNKIPNLEHMFRTLFVHEMHKTEGYNREKIYQLQEYWDEYPEPKLSKIPTNSYTILIPFTKKDQKWQILTAQRLNVTIYPNQYETMRGSIEETDKRIFTTAIRECKEETGYTPEEIRMQLILNHQYLSINKNGTQTFVKGIHDIAQVEKRIQIFTFIYYVYPKEFEKFTNKEPEKASPRKWMTLEEVQHELFTPTIHYYKEEIFDKHIPTYWEEFTLKGRVCTKGTHSAIQQIVKAQNINVTVPVITVTQTPTNIPSPTTIITTQTVIQSPSTNYFNDTNAVNTLIAELVTIAISTIVITIIICIKKRNTKVLKQQIQRLATTQTSRPPDYQGYP
ncbi:hypothetical protein C2G38_2163973 [Gigaspora rosea]|uniref:Nudix hydrolase domain-containing protein n=1 Tax=Gigaspora rosea TaxID=44941 RepID=A0A397VXY6_9GLOM|nr:hypothetical protein C2G38_2163973 [Gigaspora rosea]